jgi:DNA-binding NtrC family response regulator
VKRESILVVDDEEIMREFLRETLTRCGYTVGTAADGDAALAALAADPYRLVLLDIAMPKRTGIETLDEIRNLWPGLPVVMMTAYGTVDSAVLAMRNGAVDYLQKPFDADAIEAVVERILEVGRLRAENKRAEARLAKSGASKPFIGSAPATERVLLAVRAAAASRSTVLVTGESGTGKELVARALHEMSPRRGKPFVKVNCAAIPEGLLESELFGHERGAFTGAVKSRAGHFESAHGGTLLLDELGEAGPSVQAKLLRVIQEREIMRVGDGKAIAVDVRLIATTNRNLADEVRAGRFRGDLYYRINVIPIFLPPLRERREDIPLLVEHFVTRYCREAGAAPARVTDAAMRRLVAHDWPGNIRELENTIERAVVLGRGETIDASDIPLFRDAEEALLAAHPLGRARGALREEDAGDGTGVTTRGAGMSDLRGAERLAGATLEQAERDLILSALREEGGNRTRAAARLGISVRTVRNKLARWRAQGALLAEAGCAD